jgi:hypothetical protein
MNAKVTAALSSDPVRSLDHIRPQAAKAALVSDQIGPAFSTVTWDALIAFYGSVKGAAYALGEGAGQPRLDESLMKREIKSGDCRRLQFASPGALAVIAMAYVEAFGPLAATPHAQARRLIRDGRALLDQLDQVVEALAS